MRWLVLLLLLPWPVSAQGAFDVQLDNVRFDFGPEDWKDTQRPEWAAVWNGTLGLHLDVDVTVSAADDMSDWSFEATLTDGGHAVTGLVQAVERGAFSVRFDVDGQRALPGRDPIPALEPGRWVLQVRAFDEQGGQTSAKGTGSAAIETQALRGLADADMVPDSNAAGAETFVPVPASLVPHVDGIGDGAVWITQDPQTPGAPTSVAVDAGTGGRLLQWVVHVPRSNLPDVLPGTPLAGSLGQVEWLRQELGSVTTFEDGYALATLNSAEDRRDILILTIFDATHGGAASFVIPVSADRVAAESLRIDGPFMRLTFDEAPSEAHVVSREPGVRVSTTIQRATVTPDGTASWPAEATRDGRTGYRILALWRDEDGGYASHTTLDRGVDAEAVFPTLGVGQRSRADLLLSNPTDNRIRSIEPDFAIAGQYTLTGPEGKLQGEAFAIAEASTIRRPFTLQPSDPGRLELGLTIETADLVASIPLAANVLERDDFEQAQKPWYDPGKYVPGPGAALLLGLLGATWARRKR